MRVQTILLGQLASVYDRNGWFACLKHSLKGLTAEQAAWKPEGADNSIYEIINHLNYYNNAYLERFRGNDYEYTLADNDATFDHSEAATWDAEAARFDSIMNGWREALENADESKFNELVPDSESKWKAIVSSIIAHAAHHGGQIVLLRKLQGSWDSSGGVS